jgi:hypothetical protein
LGGERRRKDRVKRGCLYEKTLSSFVTFWHVLMPYKDPQGYHKEGIKGRDQMRSPIRCSSLADSFEAPPTHNKVCE